MAKCRGQNILIACVLSLLVLWNAGTASPVQAAVAVGHPPTTAPATAPASAPIVHLVSTKPANVFSTNLTIRFRLNPPAANAYQWCLRDWHGKLITSGHIPAMSRVLKLPSLPPGYYELRFRGVGETAWQPMIPFARIVAPSRRQPSPLCPFCVNNAQPLPPKSDSNNNPAQPADPGEILSELVHLSGVPIAREPMDWGTVNPKPDVYDWDTCLANADLLTRHNVKILYCLKGAPSWDAPGPRNGIPHLMPVYRFARAAARKFTGGNVAWECWSREDTQGNIAAWDYAAAQKAAYLGFKAGDPKATVLNGALSSMSHFPMLEGMLANGMGDYFDIFSFHADDLNFYLDTRLARKVLAYYGYAKPIWITKMSWAQGGVGQPLWPGDQFPEYSGSQARRQARQLVKNEMRAVAEGVSRTFWFSLPPYDKWSNVFGLIRFDWKVKPAYVALANLIAQLGNSQYVGRLSPWPRVQGYLFAQNGDPGTWQTLVVWSDSDQGGQISIPVVCTPAKRLLRVNAMGTSTVLLPDQNGQYVLNVGHAPIFLVGLSSLRPQSVPPSDGAIMAPVVEKDLSTVLRLRLGRAFTLDRDHYFAKLPEQQGRAILDIYNFSTHAAGGLLSNECKGWIVHGFHRAIMVPPMSRISVPMRVQMKPHHLSRQSDLLLNLKFGAKVFGKPVDPVIVPVGLPLRQAFARCRVRSLLITDPQRWAANTPGKLTINLDSKLRAVRFHVVFKRHDGRWLYPIFALPLQGENLAGSAGISFQVKIARGEKPPGWAQFVAVLNRPGGPSRALPYRMSEHWRTVRFLWGGVVNPARIVQLQIGCNPPTRDFTYWVRNLNVYYAK